MSKVDGLRAMREARYERAQALAKGAAQPKKAAAKKSAPKKTTAAKAAPTVVPETDETEAAPELCGHRNMSGRTCTRESGHAAKNHRYS